MSTKDARALEEVDSDEDLGVLDELVGYHLRRADNVFTADFTRVLEGRGMRQVPFGVLSVVATNPGIHQGAIGRILAIKRPNMVSLINELVDAQLIERRTVPEDRRAFALFLTDQGAETYKQCCGKLRLHEERLLADFSAGERRTLLDFLRRLSR